MQLRPGVRWSRQTTAAETRRRHSEIAAIFLHQNIRRDFRGTKKRMLRRIDAHGFGNPQFDFVAGLDFPARFEFAQWQTIGGIAIHVISGRKIKWRSRASLTLRLEHSASAV